MVDIFDYLDYRKFLKDRYIEKQAGDAKFTHRVIGKLGGFDPGLFSKVLFGQRNISMKLVPGFCAAFNLSGKESQYFAKLVQFNQAKTFVAKKALFERLVAKGSGRVAPVSRGQYEYYSKWYHTAIRELLNYHPFRGDFKELGRQLRPAIGAMQAKRSVALLERLGMIRKSKDRGYELTSMQVTTGYETRSLAVDNFILQALDLAKEKLKRIPGNKRNFSTLTFSIDQNRVSELEDRIRTFRRELAEWIGKEQKPDSVYHLNVQLFPLTSVKPGRSDD